VGRHAFLLIFRAAHHGEVAAPPSGRIFKQLSATSRSRFGIIPTLGIPGLYING
jgi:hypothetical protein